MSRLSPDPFVHETASIAQCHLGQFTEIQKYCKLNETTVGDYSYLMEHCSVYNAVVGKFSNIASYVRLNATNHPLERATLHHFTYRANDYWDDAQPDSDFFQRRKDLQVIIGHDTWLGHGSTVLPGISIGNGAVIAAGAVVTKDVAPNSVVGGVAASFIKYRFEGRVIDRLEELSWWNWSHEKLREALQDFRDLAVEPFLEKYEGN